MAPRDDVWLQILVLLQLVPQLVAEALGDCDEAEQEELVEAVLLDCTATLTMVDDPAAPLPFGPISNMLRRLGDRVDQPPGLAVRLQRFEDCLRLLRDLDAHHRLPALAPDGKDGSP